MLLSRLKLSVLSHPVRTNQLLAQLPYQFPVALTLLELLPFQKRAKPVSELASDQQSSTCIVPTPTFLGWQLIAQIVL